MKKVSNKLPTGVTCTFDDKGGRIEVLSSKMTVVYNSYLKEQQL